ncbi:BrnA antitoxin family protein [Luteimonas granuli]|uniref:BrnA antitoxin family protein n=1 Tax=Luteimonas granuli TaxID=1176533 RepID=A0A518N360_9GAMM|nr:BrnA antitoxin family protein [Luteimonas granuli]QDW66356.1 BrnA antitoxin family protein [Luteimonas granuli]
MSSDEDILDSYVNDAKTARRGAVLSSEGKTRITMYLDNRVIEHFREVATAKGRGYQTEINDCLVAAMERHRQKPVPSRTFVQGLVITSTVQSRHVREPVARPLRTRSSVFARLG